MAVGRISGPLLKSNLIRNGIDLAFETDLLYLDVNNQRVGVRKSDPQHELDVNGTVRTSDLIVNNIAEIADISITGNTISTDQPFLNLGTLDTVVSLPKIEVDFISLENNEISTNEADKDLEISPQGTGETNINSDLNVSGNIFTTGDITLEGNIVIGDEITDEVTFNAKVISDIIPEQTNTFSLGSDPTTGGKEWADVFTNNLFASAINSSSLDVDGIDLTLRQGNTLFVAQNGNDANSGDHVQDPFATVKHALSQATDGDTIVVYPGEYLEEFPLEVPVGVTVKGHGLRSVSIKPTTATETNDAFLLNGETTVTDLTVKDFFFDSVNNTGYAFRFAPGFTVTTRSPYVQNISVITAGSTTSTADPRGFDAGDAGKGIFLDGSVATAGSKQASGLFNAVTLITPGVDAVTLTNGVRVEWLSSFTYFANRSFFCVDGADGLKGTGRTQVRVGGLSGSVSAGETIEYYDEDGVTVLDSAQILEVTPDNKFIVDGKPDNFETPAQRGGKTIVANGDAQISNSVVKFGSGSLLLDGDGDFASISSQTDFGFGENDFTVEAWVYPTTTSSFRFITDFTTTADDNAAIVFIEFGVPKVVVQGSEILVSNQTVSTDVWTHIAFTRNGTTSKLFVNGVEVDSTTDTIDYGVSKPLVIGAKFDGSQAFWSGFIDDVRVINGTAFYTESFTLPIQRALVTDDTVLMARFDGEDGSTEFRDDVIIAQDIRFTGGATATSFELLDFTEFGAEVRMISSASVYGNQGLVGDGAGVLVYAIGHNVAYIGTGKDLSNDTELVIQENEVIELNGAKIRFVSVDHRGDFRVGDLFRVNQETGEISFTAANFNLGLGQGITFTDGSNTTFIDGSKIETGDFRISGNTIETLTGDFNIAADSDQVNIDSNTEIAGDISVDGDTALNGNITLGTDDTNTVEFNARVNSNIVPAQDSEFTLGAETREWKAVWLNQLNVDSITVSNNFITTTESNADLELRANGTGNIVVPNNNVLVSNNLEITGIATLNDVVITGDLDIAGDVTHVGNYDLDGNLSVGGTVSIDSFAQFEEIRIETNFITTTSSNADLELRASGTGKIVVPFNDVEITQDLEVTGDITAANLATTGEITADSFTNNNVLISGNTVETTVTDSDLNLIANGTGYVVIDDFEFENNTIVSAADFVIEPGSGLAVIDATGALGLPIGTTLERPTPETGQIRFNTDLSRFEGYNGVNWIQLHGVIDLDGTTRVTAELTEGANDNTIRFIADDNVTVDVTEDRLRADRINVDDIEIDNNEIKTVTTDTDLIINPDGSGAVVVDDFTFTENSITNTVSDGVTLFNNTNNGYFKFTGTSGLVFPVGTNSDRPPSALSEVGMTRYNTEQERLEVYDGTSWISVAGAAAGITRTEAEDIAIDIVLTLG